MTWYQEKWNRGHVLEKSQTKLVWDFEFNFQKATTPRRPDLMLEENQTETVRIWDLACPQDNNIENKRLEKRTNYKQLGFEIRERERRPGYKLKVVLLVISAFGGAIKGILKELENMFEKDDLCEKNVAEIQKSILINNDTIIRKVLSGLV